eukprot:SAG31_NODE_1491_length_8133_cov_8.084267_8_plen_117_part_00
MRTLTNATRLGNHHRSVKVRRESEPLKSAEAKDSGRKKKADNQPHANSCIVICTKEAVSSGSIKTRGRCKSLGAERLNDAHVVPKGHKSESHEDVANPMFPPPKRDVEVPDAPLVK